jgi:hypothetical protein
VTVRHPISTATLTSAQQQAVRKDGQPRHSSQHHSSSTAPTSNESHAVPSTTPAANASHPTTTKTHSPTSSHSDGNSPPGTTTPKTEHEVKAYNPTSPTTPPTYSDSESPTGAENATAQHATDHAPNKSPTNNSSTKNATTDTAKATAQDQEYANWTKLSLRGAWILTNIATPISLGLSNAEVAHQIHCSPRRIPDLLAELRNEIEQLSA